MNINLSIPFSFQKEKLYYGNHKSKTVQIARIKYGSKKYENAQILYQQGYQILHDKKKLSEKEIKKLLNKMKYDHDYMLKKDNKNKTLTVIDP